MAERSDETSGSSARKGNELNLRVNGRAIRVASEDSRLLLEVLREDLGLTGTKCGCDDSSCGACTVLADGAAVLSCTLLAASMSGAEIVTIEGLNDEALVKSIQQGFAESGGAQCGFCTPGMVLAVKALIDAIPDPTDEDIRNGLSGNICRCTGYVQIYESVRRAITDEVARRRSGERPSGVITSAATHAG